MEQRNIKNLRIIRLLIANTGKPLTKYSIAKQTNCSRQWVIEFLRKLESKKLVKNTKMLDVNKLIDFYLNIMPRLKHFDFYVQDPIRFLQKSNLEYALTTYAAENFITKHLFPTRYDIYIDENDLDKWKALILKNGLLGKGNLRLLMANDKVIFKESQIIKSIKIVSMPQLLVDLKRENGVCMQAYEILVKRYV